MAARRPWALWIALAAASFIVHFSRLGEMGLYEDDYNFIAPGFAPMALDEVLGKLVSDFKTWPNGRPLGFFLSPVLTKLGALAGGLPGVYALGGLIVALNAVLFHAVAAAAAPPRIALLSALGFLLYPADSSATLLTHALVLQPAVTFFLAAALLFLRGHRLLPYPLLLASVLCYESPLVVFLGVPLLLPPDENRRRELVRNAVVVIGMGVATMLVRAAVGEVKAINTHTAPPAELAFRVVASLVIGPAVSLSSYAWAPAALLSTSWSVVGVIGLVLGAGLAPRTRPRPGAVPPRARAPERALLLAALALVALGYGASFKHFPPAVLAGRGSRMHIAASFGAALAFGCVASALLRVAARRGIARVAWGLLGLELGLLAGYHQSVLAEYVARWDEQRRFWRDVTETCPDLQDGTLVLVHTSRRRDGHILAQSWATPIAMLMLHHPAPGWTRPPRLFVVECDGPLRLDVERGRGDEGLAPEDVMRWREGRLVRLEVRGQGEAVEWRIPIGTWPSAWEPLEPGNVILLVEGPDGRLRRAVGSLTTPVGAVPLKPPGPPTPLAPGPLWSLLLGG